MLCGFRRLDDPLVLLMIGVLSFGLISSESMRGWWACVGAIILILETARGRPAGIRLAFLSLLLLGQVFLPWQLRHWPFSLLLPLLGYALAFAVVSGGRRGVWRLRWGTVDAWVCWWAIATTLLSSFGLVLWVRLLQTDLSRFQELMPVMPVWLYPLAGLGFALVNAVMEELVFRGIIMEVLKSTFGSVWFAVGVQAVPFAAFHYLVGFPNGVSGGLMTLIYGGLLGALKHFSAGLLMPIGVHVAADFTIFALVVWS